MPLKAKAKLDTYEESGSSLRSLTTFLAAADVVAGTTALDLGAMVSWGPRSNRMPLSGDARVNAEESS